MKILQNLSLLLAFCLYCLPIVIQGSDQNERKPYIVYMGEIPMGRTYAIKEHHLNLLEAVTGSQQIAKQIRIHSYGKSFNGFVARLLPREAKRLLGEENVISVFPNTHNKLHTTRSWDYLGMPLNVNRRLNIESNIIVGLLDTGISLDCPSFNDKGFGPPPPRWKGKCVTTANFTGCNNKVIGAKYFYLEQPVIENASPMDEDGHGTHTSSTAAGVPVAGASVDGIGRGTARGGVPSARIAMYKVCWESGCSDMDMLAAFDEAIADGVNLISVSIGGPPRDFFSDPIAIGSFHAMRRGILTSCSAGNDGPDLKSVENVAPWIMTVAASSMDREFTTMVALGDGKNATGISINTFTPENKMYPLTSGALAANHSRDDYGNASSCDPDTLSKEKVMGRIVYCLGQGNQDWNIKELGGAGTIVALDERADYGSITIIPGSYVDANNVGKQIELYINSTKDPVAIIYKSISTRVPAPRIISFSSRGPQSIANNILKPDLAAPGANILAGYSKLPSLTGNPEDTRHNVFNILSGTSMACPHATAAAAYVKSFRPGWSPAAIKSALMTTATPMSIKDNSAELGSGSGQINPLRAIHPGLLYDMNMNSYIAYLCKEGYTNTNIDILIGSKGFNCSTIAPPPQSTDGINYPSMHLRILSPDSEISAIFYRSVTNVGQANSTYKAIVTAPKGLSIEVVPDILQFSRVRQELSFKVVLKGPPMPMEVNILSASIEWNDSRHSVRSPILVYKE
ncbi:PREDICTED: subtilisin-like protease SBT4.15 isoform X1 [Lupinus angustifolius]|uniref:subtilisin-like protease SBT4.15 isoform X1 n=1 Tax=Lupinus angustifolius TaxID=3871 RepID=UPI00092FD506|nr:PREDICTED: subtilisin-like protease SBT4.15 isoform X1 [Lupinus angustifolius]